MFKMTFCSKDFFEVIDLGHYQVPLYDTVSVATSRPSFKFKTKADPLLPLPKKAVLLAVSYIHLYFSRIR